MRAGDLRERVVIQEAVESPDGGGGAALTWRDIATVWAEIIPLSGREQIEAGGLVGVSAYRVNIRRRVDVTSAHRLVWGETTLVIKSPPTADVRRRMSTFLCEAGVVS